MAIKKNVQEMMKAINKKYGAGTIVTAGSAVAVKVDRISTGSLTLDCETGGGFPCGRITMVAGAYSAGKTYICLKGVAEAQKKFPDKNPVWIDQEGVFEREWAEALGVIVGSEDPEQQKNDPPNALLVVRPNTAEDALDITTFFMDKEDISMLVYDSLASNSPKDEIEGSMEDWTMGLAARLNNKFFRKGQAIFNMGSLLENKHKPAVIIINQVRKTMDKYKPEVMPGGKQRVA